MEKNKETKTLKKKIENKLLGIARSFGTVYEISIRNALSVVEAFNVFKIYNIFDYRLHKDFLERGGEYEFYSPELEEKAFRLTEKYLDIKRIKELNKSINENSLN
jgi:hypothetical protein